MDNIEGVDKSLIVLTTTPDLAVAERIAATLVERHLAACVNIVPGLISMYRWKSELQRDNELLLVIKTIQSVYPRVEAAISELHPYELPEIIALPVSTGSNKFLHWIEGEVDS
ncbi:MAG: divalent-cation tolerance protein CutA [Calditrichaeota bacterium]|nr:divalent-cation tolerance protein CutA [Calditrichota bacterium]